MHKMGAIGAADAVMAFRALGLDTAPVETAQEAAREVNRMAREGYAVIFITEEEAAQIAETLSKYTSQPLPAIIPIPGSRGSNGLGMQALRKNVEKAVGADILFQKEG